MNITAILETLDTYDVLGLGVIVVYGFWRVVATLHKIEISIAERLHRHDVRIVKLETKSTHNSGVSAYE